MTDTAGPQPRLEAMAERRIGAAPGRRPYAESPWYSWAMVFAFQAVMLAWLIPLVRTSQWSASALMLLVMAVVLSPAAARSRAPLRLPVPLELGLVAFVFAALFLGEVANFYERFHWWDMVLHASSGVLFSLVGVPLAYSLERQHGRTELTPRLAYLFAPMFAMSVGTFWEIFEFGLQKLSGLPIQVPQMSNWEGLADTMWDLILNALGAILVAAYGWRRFRPGSPQDAPGWVARFMAENPRFLVRGGA